MKKLILFGVLLLTSFSVSQDLKIEQVPVKTQEVDKKIDSLVEKNKEDSKVIKLVLEQNQQKLKTLEEIDKKEEALLDRLVTYFKNNKNKSKKNVTISKVKPVRKSNPDVISAKPTVDSICLETYRPLFGEKKCIRWGYITLN